MAGTLLVGRITVAQLARLVTWAGIKVGHPIPLAP